jgi:ribose 5-phosphate isomerase A
MRVLADLGGVPVIRDKYRTDQGNLVADCHFPTLGDPRVLAATLSAIPGVLGHGLFLDEVDAVYIASKGVVTRLERSGASA